MFDLAQPKLQLTSFGFFTAPGEAPSREPAPAPQGRLVALLVAMIVVTLALVVVAAWRR